MSRFILTSGRCQNVAQITINLRRKQPHELKRWPIVVCRNKFSLPEIYSVLLTVTTGTLKRYISKLTTAKMIYKVINIYIYYVIYYILT